MSNTWILMIILHNSTLLLTVHEEGIGRFLWSIGIPVFIFVLSSLAFLALFYSRWVWTSKIAREERWRNWFWECFSNYFWKKFSLAGETNKFRTVNKISNCWEYAVSRTPVVHMVDYSSANEFPILNYSLLIYLVVLLSNVWITCEQVLQLGYIVKSTHVSSTQGETQQQRGVGERRACNDVW